MRWFSRGAPHCLACASSTALTAGSTRSGSASGTRAISGGLALEPRDQIAQELESAPIERAVVDDQLHVGGQALADPGGALFGAEDDARELQHAADGPGVVGRREHWCNLG